MQKIYYTILVMTISLFLIFFLLLLVGFLIFNPLNPNETVNSNSKLNFAIYCFVCMAGFIYFFYYNDIQKIIGNNIQKPIQNTQKQTKQVTINKPKVQKNSIIFNPNDNQTHQLTTFTLTEYDYKTVDEIYKSRINTVKYFSEIIDENYSPNLNVVGNIQNNKPWWGTEGIICKGSGSHASDGLSRESSYWNNPLILLDLSLGYAMNDSSKKSCENAWPQPYHLLFSPKTKTISVTYNLSGFMDELKGSAFYEDTKKNPWFNFGGINARDFGYEYAYAYDTDNIRFAKENNVASNITKIVNYWCLGHSCDIEGGCNNICPSNDNFAFFVDSYPAYAKFKLYKQKPDFWNSEPDAYFNIYLE